MGFLEWFFGNGEMDKQDEYIFVGIILVPWMIFSVIMSLGTIIGFFDEPSINTFFGSIAILIFLGCMGIYLPIEIFKYIDKRWIKKAEERERAMDYDTAIKLWEKLGKIEDAARVRGLKANQGTTNISNITHHTVHDRSSVNVSNISNKTVHGDYVDDRDTIVKDSVINRSNVGGGSSKMEEIEKLANMKEKGLIDDDEFKQMKKEILEK